MKKLHNFNLFLESKKETSISSKEVEREVKKIITEMFDIAKNIKFSGNKDDEPEYVEFEISANDYKLNYNEELFMEYTEGVMKKRKYQVSLKFFHKSKEESANYKIMFKIKLKPVEDIKFDKKQIVLGWNFEEKPIKIINFIKKSKGRYEWNDSESQLTMKKSDYDKIDSDQLKVLINEVGGVKVRIK